MISTFFKNKEENEFVFVDDSSSLVRAVGIDQDADKSPSNSRAMSPRGSEGGKLFQELLERLQASCPQAGTKWAYIPDHLSRLAAFYRQEGMKLFAIVKAEVQNWASKVGEDSQLRAKLALSFLVLLVSFGAFSCILMVETSKTEMIVAEDFVDFSHHRNPVIDLVDTQSVQATRDVKVGNKSSGTKYALSTVEHRIQELVINYASLQADRVISSILKNRRLLALNETRDDSTTRNWNKGTCELTGSKQGLSIPPVEWTQVDLDRIAKKWKAQLAFDEQIKRYMNLNIRRDFRESTNVKANLPKGQEEMKNVYASPANWRKLKGEIPHEKWRSATVRSVPDVSWEKMVRHLNDLNNTNPSQKTESVRLWDLPNFDFDEMQNSFQPRFSGLKPEKINKAKFDLEMAKLKRLDFEFRLERLRKEKEEAAERKKELDEQIRNWREVLERSTKQFTKTVEEKWLSQLKKNVAEETNEPDNLSEWKKALNTANREYYHFKARRGYSSDKFLEMRKKRIDMHLAAIYREEASKKREDINKSIVKQLKQLHTSTNPTQEELRMEALNAATQDYYRLKSNVYSNSTESKFLEMRKKRLDMHLSEMERKKTQKTVFNFQNFETPLFYKPPNEATPAVEPTSKDADRIEYIEKLKGLKEEREMKAKTKLDEIMNDLRAKVEKFKSQQNEPNARKLEGNHEKLPSVDWKAFHARMARKISASSYEEVSKAEVDDVYNLEKLRKLKIEAEIQKWKRQRYEEEAEKMKKFFAGAPTGFDIQNAVSSENQEAVAVAYGNSVDSASARNGTLITELSWAENGRKIDDQKCPLNPFQDFDFWTQNYDRKLKKFQQ